MLKPLLCFGLAFGSLAVALQAPAQTPAWGGPPPLRERANYHGFFVFHYDYLSLALLYDHKGQRWSAPMPLDSAYSGRYDKEILQAFAPLQTPISLYRNGHLAGRFAPQEQSMIGCGDFSLTLKGQWLNPVGEKERPALGFSSDFKQTQKKWPRPQALNHTQLHSLTAAWLKTQKVPGPFKLGQVQYLVLESAKEQRDILFVDGHTPATSKQAICPDSKFWYIAERPQGSTRPFSISTGKTHLNGEEELSACGGTTLVSSFNLRGLQDHFLIEHSGYEWWDYSVWQRQANGRYIEHFRGGGGGC